MLLVTICKSLCCYFECIISNKMIHGFLMSYKRPKGVFYPYLVACGFPKNVVSLYCKQRNFIEKNFKYFLFVHRT